MAVRIVTFTLLLLAFAAGLYVTAEPRLESRAVRSTVDQFMRARMMRDAAAARSFLTNDLHHRITASGFSLIGASNPHYHAYRIDEPARGEGGAWQVRVIVTEEFSGMGETGWFEERLTLVPSREGYRIAEIERGEHHPVAPPD